MDKKKTIASLVIVALIATFFYLNLDEYLSLETLKSHRDALSAFYSDHRLLTVLAFIFLYIVQTALALPGAIVFSFSAGVLFGAALGTIYAVTAATLGAVFAFLVTRYLFYDTVQRKLGGRLDRLNATLEREGLNYLLFLRFVPLFPFFLINLGAALTRLPLRIFFFGTFVGIIPGAFVYVNAGASLTTIDNLGDVASPRVLGSFFLLGVFALAPVVYQRLKYNPRTRAS